MNIRGRAVLVTGASQGLGAALARALAARGARVVLLARCSQALARVVAAIRERGGEAHAIAADVGDVRRIHAVAGEAAALVGPLDIVVHNASTLGRTPLPLLLDTECEDFTRVLEVNLLGPFRLSKAIAGSMAARGRGLLVHVSSDAAVEAYPGWGAYGVSKAALDQLARSWASELGDSGVRVLSIDPGEMDTQMHREAVPDADASTLARPEAVAERVAALIERVDALPNGARIVAQQAAP